jgi:hypothetical protein
MNVTMTLPIHQHILSHFLHTCRTTRCLPLWTEVLRPPAPLRSDSHTATFYGTSICLSTLCSEMLHPLLSIVMHLFHMWFAGSHLHYPPMFHILDVHPPPAPPSTTPTPRLDHFVTYTLHHTCLHPSVTFPALYLLHHLMVDFSTAKGSSSHRLFISLSF